MIQNIRKIKGNPPIALCGCKADLVKERGIDVKTVRFRVVLFDDSEHELLSHLSF